MYKIFYSYLLLMLFFGTASHAAKQQYPTPDQLEVYWHVYENHYLGKDQTLFSIGIRNHGKQPFPKTGWKIYFNLGKRVSTVSGTEKLKVNHVNGGLYYISPGKDLNAVGSGESLEQQFISNSWVVNSSDAPEGFYLVWDNASGVGIPLNDVKISSPKDQRKMDRFAGDKELSQGQHYLLNERGKTENSSPPKIFPAPLSYTETPGHFKLDHTVTLVSDPEFNNEAQLFADELKLLTGKRPFISNHPKKTGTITLKRDASIKRDGYTLKVTPSGIVISAKGPREIHYGIQSLKVMLDPSAYAGRGKNKALLVKCVAVEDRPAFGFRAIMLDVARNFQAKEEVMKLIDLLSLYKFTTLHLHLNDDEGWRLQINALPELTSVGANRGHGLNEQESLMPAYGSGPIAGQSSGSGYYSRADFMEILKYAARRHINIIPEIETPGHARAAIVSMQARYNKIVKSGDTLKAKQYLLRDMADSSVYRSVQQWNDHVMDVSMPSVYNFLETVTDEIIEMYKLAGAPLQTIHYGGDEVPAGVWTASPSVDAFKAKHSEVKNAADLWDYFFGRLADMLDKRKLYLSGWEETALRKSTLPGGKKWQPNPLFLDRNFHVNVWNNMSGNEDLAYRLANSGYKVILSFVTNFYFDMAYVREFEEPGFNWGGFINLEQAYKFIPFDYLKNQHTDYVNRPLPKSMLQQFEPLTEVGQQNIYGIQGLLWTETVKTAERLEYMYLPRLLALSERAWASTPAWATMQDTLKAKQLYERDWYKFSSSVRRELNRLDHYAGGFEYRIPTPAIMLRDGMVSANTDVPGFKIYYTTDGSTPTVKSKRYQQPVPHLKGLRFRAFNEIGRGGEVAKNDTEENGKDQDI
ncbi:carbohydate-binding domain-containing protein [Pedobacter sp. N36a]|uniref:family 20 glycosylhydrolase n=1 Tax=Pedobacter sp. N36a TaxID=2767996 RepID=UPI001656AB31|nr:family 20 glycosylhydrolase [Pedobacter sp. N36a]MBC8986715.1 carbohydate-binding domain-containing protein [Pedobacter sp. N36a]